VSYLFPERFYFSINVAETECAVSSVRRYF